MHSFSAQASSERNTADQQGKDILQAASPGSLTLPAEFHFQTEPFLRVLNYAQSTLELPRLFYNALSLLDSKEGCNSFHLLFQFQTLCHEWLLLAKEGSRLFEKLSRFEEQLSHFCLEEAAAIQNLPAAEQCKTGILSDTMRSQLCDMHQQTVAQAKSSLHFQNQADDIRRQMENDIQPQAAIFRKMLDAQPALLFENQWKRFEIPYCGFLKDNPVVSGFIRRLTNASSKQESEQIWNSLHQTAEALWNEIQDAFSHIGALSQDLMQISADIRGLNVLWTSTGQYLSSMEQTLSAAADSKRLLGVRSQLEICAGQCENTVRFCQSFAKQLETKKIQ